MKIIAFYNEKGGSGKTTLTALAASYFAYKLGERVECIDFDKPSYQLYNIRATDLNNYKSVAEVIRAEAEAGTATTTATRHPFYPLFRLVSQNTVPFYPVTCNKEKTESEEDRVKFALSLLARKKREDGYLFLDFPGSRRKDDLSSLLIYRGIIDLVVFPIDSDRQSQSAAFFAVKDLNEWSVKAGCGDGFLDRVLFLWNREAAKEHQASRDWYAGPEQMFRAAGIPVAGRRIRDILIARRDSDTFGFIRNTLCWPELNVRKAANYLPQIFDEIKLRADGKWNTKSYEKIYGKDENK